MTVRVGFVTNPLDPRTWEEIETADPRAAIQERFPSWPANGRIYDLEGVGDWRRAASIVDPGVLATRDVTPRDDAGVERLGQLRGPVLVVVPPADPLTAILTVVAVAVGVAAAFLFLPKINTATQRPQSPNNSLADRTNQPRPNGRIADIFGTVESTPDLLMQPYSVFENNVEVEVAYMAVGRGSYAVSRVRDGDTAIASIAGSSAAVYGPGTSPNSGDAPQLQIGAAIADDVQTVLKLNEVNGQTLKATNVDFIQGEDSIRFVYPDTIETNDPDVDFTDYFEADDAIAVAQADLEGAAGTTTTTASARCNAAGEIEFQTLNPTTAFSAGQFVTLSNAGYVGTNDGARELTFNPATFPAGHSTVLDRVKSVRLVGINPAKFYRVYHLFFKDIGTRAALWVYQSDDAADTNSVAVAAWVVGSGASNVGLQSVALAAQGGSGITGSAVIEFGDGTASFAHYNGTYANSGLSAGVLEEGGSIFVDLAGTYEIDSVTATKVILVDPDAANGDWLDLASFPNDRTDYRDLRLSVAEEGEGLNLNGNYTALAVTASTIVLNNPALVNANWNNIDDLPGDATEYVSPSISRNTESWAGPFIIDLDDTDRVLVNIVAMNGLYTLSEKKGKQAAMTVGFTLELTPVNSNDAAIGPAELFPGEITGSATEKTTVGVSLFAEPSFTGRCSVRLRRTTASPKDDDFAAIVDEIKWRDCYGLAPIEQTEFGDITTVHTRTIATPGALSLKSRKLNMRVTRKVPARVEGSTFGALTASDNIADIISAICLDPLIGRRSISEVDFDSIYDTIAEAQAYFGSSKAVEFGYTFDTTDISFEETLQTVAQAAFCTAYRQGRVIRLAFERATENSSLIFNARNVLPATQKRTVRFGPLDDHDGVELDFTDPTDGATLTLLVPAGSDAESARELEIPGVRSYELAYWQAWRAWNKVRYQNTAVELEATQEAALVIPKDRILIADMTRPDIIQGEVEAASGTTLTLSQPVDLDPARYWTIFLQHIDGTVEPLGVAAGANDYQVELSAAPRMALSVDAENFARATYMIVPDDDVQTRAFLLAEREPNSNFTETVRAINYSFLYYQNDELIIWLAFDGANFYDSGPYRRDAVAVGGATTIADADRGTVFSGLGAGKRLTFPAFTTPESYTKAAWIKRGDLATAGQLLGNANESFGFAASAMIQAGHAGGVHVEAEWPDATDWHHAAIAYDADLATMALYIDGLLVDEADAVPERVIAQLIGFDGYLGRGDDLRLWKRALTAQEVRSVYLASQQA